MYLECSICIDSITVNDTLTVTPCGHLFHSNCLSKWRLRSSMCPQCRCENKYAIRLFLNKTTNSNEASTVAGDSVHLQLNEARRKIEQLSMENSQYFDDMMRSRNELREYMKMSKSKMNAQEDQNKQIMNKLQIVRSKINSLTARAERIPDLERKIRILRYKWESAERALSLIDGETLLTETQADSLFAQIMTLKRHLKDSETQRNSMRTQLKETQAKYDAVDDIRRELEVEMKAMNGNFAMHRNVIRNLNRDRRHSMENNLILPAGCQCNR